MPSEVFQPRREPQGEGRPLLTFFLICYNQERFIRAAVEAALAQSYQPLEIVLSDDSSPDRTFEVMREVVAGYDGPHRVVLNRNEKNLGLSGNVNRLLDLANGELIVIAGGDDISLPDRVERSWRILTENPQANCVSFRYRTIDADGNLLGAAAEGKGGVRSYTLEDYLRSRDFHHNGASRAFRTSVFRRFGALSAKCPTEDSTNLLRCLMVGSVCFCDEVGIDYRVHGGNYYSSDKKFAIKHKRIHWQYLKDLKVAQREGALDAATVARLKQVLRRRLKEKLLTFGYHRARRKVSYFLRKMLFSPLVGPRAKVSLFLAALRPPKCA